MRQVRLYAALVAAIAVVSIVTTLSLAKGGSSGGSKGGSGSGHAFNPADHPRGPDGRFIPKGSSTGGPSGVPGESTPPPDRDPTTRASQATSILHPTTAAATSQPATRPAYKPVDEETRQRQREDLKKQAERIRAEWDAQK